MYTEGGEARPRLEMKAFLVLLLLSLGCATTRPAERAFLSHGDYHYISLSEYHDVGAWEKEPSISFDEDGTLFYKYAEPIGRQRNPVTTSQYALVCFDRWLTSKDESYLTKFLSQVRSLERMATRKGEAAYFHYTFDFPRYGLKQPWISGMAQGHVASVFLRAYAVSGEAKYLELSRRSLIPLLTPVSEGGVRAKTPEGYDWIEEYPSEKPSLVLNGFVYALMGVLEHQKVEPQFPDPAFTAGLVEALKRTMHHYEKDHWLLYDRATEVKVSDNYMGNQILQMYQMYALTDDPWFRDKAREWERHYDWNRFFRAWKYETKPLTHQVSDGR